LVIILIRHQFLGKEGVEQTGAGAIGSAEARLKLVARRHQLIDLGDDAVLLGNRREGKVDRPC
jgi:hypothetical protein